LGGQPHPAARHSQRRTQPPAPARARYAFAILLAAKAILAELPSVLEVPVPPGTHLTVCGDVHGQFYDLLNIFEINGLPSMENPYLFNGDFVDRGSWSLEVILTLLAFKCLYPTGASAQAARRAARRPARHG